MFDHTRYVTRGITATLPPILVVFLWQLIDNRRDSGEELDYLQVFQLCRDASGSGNIQLIQHSQEMPDYRANHQVMLLDDPAVNTKVFVIDDVTHSTMLLAEEY